MSNGLSPADRRFIRQFGGRVRSLRLERGWSLEEVEEHGWPHWQHLQKIESGKKNITLTTLRRIAKLFNIPLSRLLEGIQ
jgi:transcriptional regulator with XRE-family HTH domain